LEKLGHFVKMGGARRVKKILEGKLGGMRKKEVVKVNGDGFGGLVVSILATGTRVRGFKPGRRRWIFRASEKSSVSHVPALRHVKNPSGILVNSDPLAKLGGSSRLRW
jgi:hypothetical protein